MISECLPSRGLPDHLPSSTPTSSSFCAGPAEKDPAVRAGLFSVDAMTWRAAKGTLSFEGKGHRDDR